MTQSRTIGPVRIRPQVKNGVATGRWFVDVPASLTGNGRRKRKLFDNRKQAADVARALARQIDPVTGLLRVRDKPSGLSLAEAMAGWLRDERLRVQTLKKRQSTLEIDAYRLKALQAYFRDEKLHEITEERLTAYQAHRLGQGRKPVTINCELATLGLVFKWAVKKGYARAVPKAEQIPVNPAPVIIPTPEEVVRIIGNLPERLRPLVRFLAETGCRKGEAVNLLWECVDEIGGYADIVAREGWTPKTGQSQRRIPLNPDLLAMIQTLPKEGPYVFTGQDPEKPVGCFKKAWASAVAKARIMRNGRPVHVPVKALRKAHATWQAERGINESVLQSLLGHARGSRVTRQFYIHATEQARRAAVIVLPFDRQTPKKSA